MVVIGVAQSCFWAGGPKGTRVGARAKPDSFIGLKVPFFCAI